MSATPSSATVDVRCQWVARSALSSFDISAGGLVAGLGVGEVLGLRVDRGEVVRPQTQRERDRRHARQHAPTMDTARPRRAQAVCRSQQLPERGAGVQAT